MRDIAKIVRPIRVAHVIQSLNYGGMERVLHSLGRELPARGFEIHIVVLEYLGRFAEGLEGGVTFHQVPRMSKLSLFRPRELTAVLQAIAPDIVHSHTGVWLKSALAAAHAGIQRMVHTEHGRPVPDRFSDRAIDRLASRKTNAVIAVSEALATVLRERIVHDPSRVRLIANGIDLARLKQSADRAAIQTALGIPAGTPVVGSVGRLESVKNYSLALRAFARLEVPTSGSCPPVLVIVGDGSERRELEILSEALGIATRVRFLGWRDDAEHLYGAFDLFTLTSRSEGTSISLLEAMGTGICPIVTDVGGNRAVLGPMLASLLVPPDDESALATAWQFHLDDPGLREQLAGRARARIASTFSLDTMIDQHVALYQSLMQSSLDPDMARATTSPRDAR
jgi:glycosyltransferase involved in cell wall biosynthesis